MSPFNSLHLRKTRFGNWVYTLAYSSVIIKTIIFAIIWSIALIPVWLFLFIRWLIDPIGFWQEFAMFALSWIILAGPQFVMFLLGSAMTAAVIEE